MPPVEASLLSIGLFTSIECRTQLVTVTLMSILIFVTFLLPATKPPISRTFSPVTITLFAFTFSIFTPEKSQAPTRPPAAAVPYISEIVVTLRLLILTSLLESLVISKVPYPTFHPIKPPELPSFLTHFDTFTFSIDQLSKVTSLLELLYPSI